MKGLLPLLPLLYIGAGIAAVVWLLSATGAISFSFNMLLFLILIAVVGAMMLGRIPINRNVIFLAIALAGLFLVYSLFT